MHRGSFRQRAAHIAQSIFGVDRHGIATTRRRLFYLGLVVTLVVIFLSASSKQKLQVTERRAGGEDGGGPGRTVVEKKRRDDIPEDVESDMTDFAPPPDEGGFAASAASSASSANIISNNASHRHRSAASSSPSMLTVVLMSYPKSSRFHILAKIIAKVRRWHTFVKEVILVWNGPSDLVPPNIAAMVASIEREAKEKVDGGGGGGSSALVVPFRILPQSSNRVDNRWRIGRDIQTDAVLNMDDDVDLFEAGALCMFSVWKTAPSSLVAIDVRSHFRHKDSAKALYGPWGYAARDQSDGYKKYSIALPRALLAHRRYYHAYEAAWSNASSGLKALVDELLCDDVAFSFVAANTTPTSSTDELGLANAGGEGGGTVVYVKAKYEAYPESHSKDAMVHKPGMKPMRQKCVNRLSADVFHGRMPLVHRRWHVLCDVDG